ncbi:MAG: (2Fe-2S)-binding protein [Bryobacteraceae bacterium]|nr:(2Fe-2S)-binding protein [Bryobacteraceae bacterium]
MAAGAGGAALIAGPGEGRDPRLEAPPDRAETIRIPLTVNGRQHSLTVEPRWTLLYALREQLGLTGTKPGCERGECGACTVLIDGQVRYACMTLAVEAAGASITTLEGLMRGEELGPVQQAFAQEDAFQCGYCTPGQAMSAEGLLRKSPNPSVDEIREEMSGNLCRCGAYPHIVKAVQRAASMRKGGVS